MFKKIISVIYILTFFLFTGCSLPKKPKALLPGNYHLAVLPMANETTNLDGPVLLRRALYKKLRRRGGFSVMPLDEIDSILKDSGITDAGQLRILSVKQLGEKLPAQRLIYSNLITFKPLRVLSIEVIKMKVSVYDALTGNLLWKDDFAVTDKQKKPKSSSFKTYLNYIFGIALVEKLFRSPLSKEIDILTKRIYRRIYRRW